MTGVSYLSDHWKTIAIGQILCLCIACSGVFSQLLVHECEGKSFPTAQSALNYLLLALVHLPIAARDVDLRDVFRHSGWQYALIAFFDVEGNALMVKAYSLTSLASVQILDCFAIPCVLVLSKLLIGSRYSIHQYAGACISVCGVCLLLLADSSSATGPFPLLGDTVCIVGASLYAASNVGQEILVKQRSNGAAFLALLGTFAFIMSAAQCAALEWWTLTQIQWSRASIWAYVFGYNACMFALYIMVPVFLRRSSATMLNITLLMADVYSIGASSYMTGTPFSCLYLTAFMVMATAVVLASVGPKDPIEARETAPLLPSSSSHRSVKGAPPM